MDAVQKEESLKLTERFLDGLTREQAREVERVLREGGRMALARFLRYTLSIDIGLVARITNTLAEL